jgi:excinuclease ABC subunit C
MGINPREIPQKIGVYLFYDKTAQMIYIGKAINLRRRVSQYFNSSRKGMEYRIQQMISNVADVKWLVEKSELHALLLEDRLIKKHWPIYNRRQKKFLRNRYLAWTNDDFPRLDVLGLQERTPKRTVFGPFPDEFFVSDLLEIIYQFHPIRQCKAPVPTAKCAHHRFRHCSAPCQDHVSLAEYMDIVNRVTGFLRGDTTEVISRLQNQIQNVAKRLNFERAGKLRDQIILCQSFAERQAFYTRFRRKNLLIKEWDPSRNTYLFCRGRLANFAKGHGSCDGFLEIGDQAEDKLHGGDREPDWAFLDRANVVYSWLRSKRTRKACEFI